MSFLGLHPRWVLLGVLGACTPPQLSAPGAGGSPSDASGASQGDGGGPAGGADPSGGAAPIGGAGGVNLGGSGSLFSGGIGADTSGGGSATGGTATGGSGTNAGGGGIPDGPDAAFAIFLLLGQSNMTGPAKAQAEDLVDDPRVEVLAYDDCPNLGRVYDQWAVAQPPLHGCYDGVGPGDSFGRAIAAARTELRVGLVPLGVVSADIDLFRKGVVSSRRNEFYIPPDDSASGAYDWMVERARLAQQVGVIRGIIFHQGESDTSDPPWVGKVTELVTDLRADLGIPEVPFLLGELLHGGCCASHNTLIAQVPGSLANSHVISAGGLAAAADNVHFSLAGQRELGERYAQKMLELWPQ